MIGAERFRRIERFVREYTAGLGGRDFQHMFGRDATRAVEVLTREHSPSEAPQGRFANWLYRARVLFLGLSYRLSPPRRILFAVALILVVPALFIPDEVDGWADPKVVLLISITALVLLLILELADRIVVRDELEVARELQSDLLPKSPPQIEGYEFAFSYRTANTIGGDYFDFLPLADGKLALITGDASGHGIAAGLLMAIANASLKLALELDPTPKAVMTLLNQALYRSGDRRAFMTLFYSVLDPSTGSMEYACSGHPYPILRHRDGSVEELGTGSFPLGIREQIEVSTSQARLEDGDLIVLYTDGIPEAVDDHDRNFGFDRLRRVVAQGGSAKTVHDGVLSLLERFVGETPTHDDRSLVVIKRVKLPPVPGSTPEPGAPPPLPNTLATKD
ncbi:MAG: PP2C family protein-serine/threonine phosphatase [bacterium]|nr:PP2C family protein-serine/threonine phosphatase [bacterium]